MVTHLTGLAADTASETWRPPVWHNTLLAPSCHLKQYQTKYGESLLPNGYLIMRIEFHG